MQIPEHYSKVVYLAMRNSTKKWTMPIHNWKPALNRLAVEFAERFPRGWEKTGSN